MNPVPDRSTSDGQNAPNLVLARLLDYFGRRTNWQRRLWNPGTVTVLQETFEAADLLASDHLRAATVQGLARTAKPRSGPDLGLGPPAVRAALTSTLAKLQEKPDSPVARHQLEELLTDVAPDYLARWAQVLSAEPDALAPEAASRLLAGHLLGLGFSPDHLHRWTTWFAKSRTPASLADIFAEADKVASRQPRRWDVLVPFAALEKHGQEMPPEWLDAAAATEWLSRHAPTPMLRHNGGFLLQIEARDPWAAAEEAGDLVESMAARVAVGQPGTPSFEPHAEAVVAGSTGTVPLGRPRRQVDVNALHRQNALFSAIEPALTGRLRSALDLVAPLETGAPGAAVAGGWAALEALLARPGAQNMEIAEDFATLVACSFPRAELTPLTFAYAAEHDDALAAELGRASSNLERCGLLGTAIKQGADVRLQNPSDQAALERAREILAAPSDVLGRVTTYVNEALQRLYRQRNLVLHAGKTDSVAMISALRTVPPLVGAGLDRLVHDALATGHSDPLRLVARARTALEHCGKDGGAKPWDLLGH